MAHEAIAYVFFFVFSSLAQIPARSRRFDLARLFSDNYSIGGTVCRAGVSYYDRRIEKEELKTQLDPKSDEIANVGDNDERNKMYTYMV